MENGSIMSLPEPESYRIKMTILGNPGIGKSALSLRFAKKDFVNFYEPTIEEELVFTLFMKVF
jgi:GTPase SAR1 family protein